MWLQKYDYKNVTTKMWLQIYDYKDVTKIWLKMTTNMITKIWLQKYGYKNVTTKIWLQKSKAFRI